VWFDRFQDLEISSPHSDPSVAQYVERSVEFASLAKVATAIAMACSDRSNYFVAWAWFVFANSDLRGVRVQRRNLGYPDTPSTNKHEGEQGWTVKLHE
jgi:hypothetical protein